MICLHVCSLHFNPLKCTINIFQVHAVGSVAFHICLSTYTFVYLWSFFFISYETNFIFFSHGSFCLFTEYSGYAWQSQKKQFQFLIFVPFYFLNGVCVCKFCTNYKIDPINFVFFFFRHYSEKERNKPHVTASLTIHIHRTKHGNDLQI